MTDAQRIAQTTLDFVDWTCFSNDKDGCDMFHIIEILQQVADGEVTGDKAHRFIGWAQAVLCMENKLPLEWARKLNKRAIEENENAVI